MSKPDATVGSSRCPQCDNVAKVSSDALAAAGGLLRCGSCGSVFNARSQMVDSTSDPQTAGSATTDKADISSVENTATAENTVEAPPPLNEPDQPEQATQPLAANSEPSTSEPQLETVVEPLPGNEPEARLRISRDSLSNDFESPPAPLHRSKLWAIAALLLGFALSLQALNHYWLPINQFADREQASWLQTSLAGLCRVLACSRPLRAEHHLLSSGGLTVREHPDLQDSLLVELFIDNRSEYAQVPPLLSLEFADISGLAIAERSFAAEDYLQGELLGAQKLPADQAIRVKLAILDPDPDAVNYRLELVPEQQALQYPLPWLAPGGR